MTDETPISPTDSAPPAVAAPRVRRISTPRPKKIAKSTAKPELPAVPTTPAFPVFDSPETNSERGTRNAEREIAETNAEHGTAETAPTSAPATAAEGNPVGGDWPEPEAASSGSSATHDHPKRKRRRKKGKGGNNLQTAPPTGESEPDAQGNAEISEAPAAQQSTPFPQGQHPRQPQMPRPKLDADLLAKFAWKIYLSEVSEEGVALIGDIDAKDLSRRCFRLAEIFLEEQTRRR